MKVYPVKINQHEWVDAGTTLIYNDKLHCGYQRLGGLTGERIALTSYEAFGSSSPSKYCLAADWTASMAAAIELM